jgi:hypothetical protein
MDGAALPGSGIASNSMDGAALPGSGIASGSGTGEPGSGIASGAGTVPPGNGIASSATGDGAASGLTGKSVWQVEHFSLAPPGGIRLSSILKVVWQVGQVARMTLPMGTSKPGGYQRAVGR